MKKLLSIILVLSTLVTLFCFPTNADETTDTGASESNLTLKAEIAKFPSGAIPINKSNCTTVMSGDTAGKTYYLAEDINISAYLTAETFSGTLYGNGKTVTVNNISLFSALNGAIVRDLIICGEIINSDSLHIGALAREAQGETNIINVTNYANVTSTNTGNYSISGLIGCATDSSSNTLSFENCVNRGSITGKSNSGGTKYATAGLLGGIANSAPIVMKYCENHGYILNSGARGTVAGLVAAGGGSVEISYCANYGTISGKFFNGGLTGYLTGTVTISYSLNAGLVTTYEGTRAAGGIAGYLAKTTSSITNCASLGDVTNNGTEPSKSHAAGIVGYCDNAITIKNCAIAGNVTKTETTAKCAALIAHCTKTSDQALQNFNTNYIIDGITNLYESTPIDGEVIRFSASDITSGKLTYIMQSLVDSEAGHVWGQTLGTENSKPELFGQNVFEDGGVYYNMIFYAKNISLHSSLMYTLFAKLPESQAALSEVAFTMNGKTEYVKPVKADKDIYGEDIYRFDFNGIAPQMIGAEIKADLIINGGTATTHIGSIVKYCSESYENTADTALNRILIDVISYGQAARAYVIAKKELSENAIPAIEQITGAVESSSAITPKNLTVVTAPKSGEPYIASASVYFDSTNKLSFNVKVPENWQGNILDYTVYVDSDKCEALAETGTAGKYSCYSQAITAADFTKDFTVSLKDGDGNVVHAIKYGVSTYASRKATSEDGVMADLAKATYYYAESANKYVTLKNTKINEKSVIDYVIVADSDDYAAAESINSAFKDKYGIELAIVPVYSSGNAILINNGGNTYGGVRYGIDADVTDNGDVKIHIDGLDSHTKKMAKKFGELLTDATSNVTVNDDFHYQFVDGSMNNGYLLSNSTSVEREIADGVRYIERTYTTAAVESGIQSYTKVYKTDENGEVLRDENDEPILDHLDYTTAGIQNTMYILILEKGAKAHIEVKSGEYKSLVDSCTNYTNCKNKHVIRKTIDKFAEEMKGDGKNVLAAINASYFMLSKHCYTPWGLQIVNGTVNTEPRTDGTAYNYQGWFAVTRDGTPIIGSSAAEYESNYKDKDILYNAVGGRKELFIENGIFKVSNNENTRTGSSDARTSIGHNANGDIVMIVSDGDDTTRNINPGTTHNDMAQLFMDLDMDITHVLWLDGGGSCAMLVKNEEGSFERENKVNYDGGSRQNRPLADIIAIVADEN